MPRTAVADLVGHVLAGRYRLLAPVGAGSSGRVYLADDVRLRRRVAVKVLHGALAGDEAFLRRFRAEAQLAASLGHPHIVAVYDWGEDPVAPFMVLELLTGGSLRALLDRGDRLTPSQAAHVGRQVAAALQYAHARGLVHRDVKAGNLLFDEHGIPRVADFGLARALAQASWTEPAGTMIGTARYAAPEQVGGAAVDGRADLYSLGVLLVEAVTGQAPGVSDTPFATLAARAARGLDAPPEMGPLGPVVERAGRPKPSERYADAAAMGAALTDAARRLPPPAPLRLPGLTEGLDDPEPTRFGPSTNLFDQDARASQGAKAQPLVTRSARRDRPPGSRTLVPLVVGVALLLVLGASALAALSAGGPTVAAPRLVGLTRDDAAALAANASVLLEVQRRTADDPAGLVIGQDPAPGAFVERGGAIRVVVSRGPPRVLLPSVKGSPMAEAQQQLEAAGFVVVVERRHDEEAPKDVVLGTRPSGKRAPREATITLVVSDGPAPVPVPDVAGRTYDEAVQLLTEQGLQATRRDDFNDTVASGTVIGTDPAAGQPAFRDTPVVVIVSKGPEMVQVPDVEGRTVEQASQILRDRGLVPDVRDYAPGKTVLAQSPDSGTTVKKGSTVILFL